MIWMIDVLLALFPNGRALPVADAMDEAIFLAKRWRKTASPDTAAARFVDEVLSATAAPIEKVKEHYGDVSLERFAQVVKAGKLHPDVRASTTAAARTLGALT